MARFLRDMNFPFRGNSNQFTIHAASTYAKPRAVVIRAANQKLSSGTTDRPTIDATSRNLYSQPKARMDGRKIQEERMYKRRRESDGGGGSDGGEGWLKGERVVGSVPLVGW